MKLFPYVILVFVYCLPGTCAAQCHHYGGHAGHHSSAHHSGGHSSHYRLSGRPHGGGNTGTPGLADPRKNINELTAHPGLVSTLQLADGNKVKYASPVYTGAYRYYVSNGIALGIAVAAQSISGRDTCKCMTINGGIPSLYDYKANTLTVAASMTILLFTGRDYQTYVGVDAGVTLINESDRYADNTTSGLTQYKFNGQATLVGLRVGHALGAFAELGFGYKGLVCMGISYQAGWKKAHRDY